MTYVLPDNEKDIMKDVLAPLVAQSKLTGGMTNSRVLKWLHDHPELWITYYYIAEHDKSQLALMAAIGSAMTNGVEIGLQLARNAGWDG